MKCSGPPFGFTIIGLKVWNWKNNWPLKWSAELIDWKTKFDLATSSKDTRNCPEKAMKISHFNPNQSAPSIYIMIELCYFSLDQWEIRIHLLWGKSFNIPHHCDPHLNQTKWLIFNDLLPLTIPGVLSSASEEEHPEMYFSERLNQHCPISKISHTASLRSVMSSKCIDF